MTTLLTTLIGRCHCLGHRRYPFERIQMTGRWSSEAFLMYLQHNPILLQGEILGHPLRAPTLHHKSLYTTGIPFFHPSVTIFVVTDRAMPVHA